MTFEFDDAALKEISIRLGKENAKQLEQLFRSLVDEEEQVKHMIRPHRIVKRINELIEEVLGDR